MVGAPDVNVDDKTVQLLKQVSLDRLMGSSEMHDANMLVSLRNHFNGRKSGVDRGAEVMNIMSNYAPPEVLGS